MKKLLLMFVVVSMSFGKYNIFYVTPTELYNDSFNIVASVTDTIKVYIMEGPVISDDNIKYKSVLYKTRNYWVPVDNIIYNYHKNDTTIIVSFVDIAKNGYNVIDKNSYITGEYKHKDGDYVKQKYTNNISMAFLFNWSPSYIGPELKIIPTKNSKAGLSVGVLFNKDEYTYYDSITQTDTIDNILSTIFNIGCDFFITNNINAGIGLDMNFNGFYDDSNKNDFGFYGEALFSSGNEHNIKFAVSLKQLIFLKTHTYIPCVGIGVMF